MEKFRCAYKKIITSSCDDPVHFMTTQHACAIDERLLPRVSWATPAGLLDLSDSEYELELRYSKSLVMGIDTQHQHSRNSDTPDDQGDHEVNHQSQDGAQKSDQVANSGGEHVDIESVSVVLGKKRKSVPICRLVRVNHYH